VGEPGKCAGQNSMEGKPEKNVGKVDKFGNPSTEI
jgi:hypothetical protein